MSPELQPRAEAERALRERAQARVIHYGVAIAETVFDGSDPPRSAETFIQEARGRMVPWNRILIHAVGKPNTNWGEVSRQLAKEGFEPYGPRDALGQTYQSRTYGWVILARPTKSKMAVDQVGDAWFGPVVGP